MADRDVERDCPSERFVETLRRVADALESGDSFRIQVANRRFTVPADAELSIEHEAGDGNCSSDGAGDAWLAATPAEALTVGDEGMARGRVA